MIGPRGEHALFLISQPRAGSTLLQRILAGNGEIATTPEPWLALLPLALPGARVQHPAFKFQTGQRALEDFLTTLPEGERAYRQAAGEMARSLYNAACTAQRRPRFLDKTPLYSLIIPQLAEIFPEAEFIFLLRNPLAVLASVLDTWVGGEWVRLARHRYNLLLAPQNLADGIDRLGERAVVVHYEALVQRPEEVVGALCGRLGLAFSPAMLQYRAASFPGGRMGDPAGVHRHTRPTPEGLNGWLALGGTRQTRHFALAYLDALGPALLARLGYNADEMRAQLEAVPVRSGGVVVRWAAVFAHPPTFWRKFRLLCYEFVQRPRPGYFVRQVGRLVAGRLV